MLQAQWDRGDRRGLAVRPASDSAHTRRNAFDLQNDKPTLNVLGREARRLGARWGGTFIPPDINHFDVEILGWNS